MIKLTLNLSHMIYLCVKYIAIMNESLANIVTITINKTINPYVMLINIIFKLRNSFLNTKLSENN